MSEIKLTESNLRLDSDNNRENREQQSGSLNSFYNKAATESLIDVLSSQQGVVNEHLNRTLGRLNQALDSLLNNRDESLASKSEASELQKLSYEVISRDGRLQERVAQAFSSPDRLVRSRDAKDFLQSSFENLPAKLTQESSTATLLSRTVLESLVSLSQKDSLGAGLERDLSLKQVYVPEKKLQGRASMASGKVLNASLAYLDSNQPSVLKTLVDNSSNTASTADNAPDNTSKTGSSTAQVMAEYLKKALEEFPDDSTYLDIFKKNSEVRDNRNSERIREVITNAAQMAKSNNLYPGSPNQILDESSDADAPDDDLTQPAKLTQTDPDADAYTDDPRSKSSVAGSSMTLAELSARAAKLQMQFTRERQRMVQEGKLPDPASPPPIDEEIPGGDGPRTENKISFKIPRSSIAALAQSGKLAAVSSKSETSENDPAKSTRSTGTADDALKSSREELLKAREDVARLKEELAMVQKETLQSARDMALAQLQTQNELKAQAQAWYQSIQEAGELAKTALSALKTVGDGSATAKDALASLEDGNILARLQKITTEDVQNPGKMEETRILALNDEALDENNKEKGANKAAVTPQALSSDDTEDNDLDKNMVRADKTLEKRLYDQASGTPVSQTLDEVTDDTDQKAAVKPDDTVKTASFDDERISDNKTSTLKDPGLSRSDPVIVTYKEQAKDPALLEEDDTLPLDKNTAAASALYQEAAHTADKAEHKESPQDQITSGKSTPAVGFEVPVKTVLDFGGFAVGTITEAENPPPTSNTLQNDAKTAANPDSEELNAEKNAANTKLYKEVLKSDAGVLDDGDDDSHRVQTQTASTSPSNEQTLDDPVLVPKSSPAAQSTDAVVSDENLGKADIALKTPSSDTLSQTSSEGQTAKVSGPNGTPVSAAPLEQNSAPYGSQSNIQSDDSNDPHDANNTRLYKEVLKNQANAAAIDGDDVKTPGSANPAAVNNEESSNQKSLDPNVITAASGDAAAASSVGTLASSQDPNEQNNNQGGGQNLSNPANTLPQSTVQPPEENFDDFEIKRPDAWTVKVNLDMDDPFYQSSGTEFSKIYQNVTKENAHETDGKNLAEPDTGVKASELMNVKPSDELADEPTDLKVTLNPSDTDTDNGDIKAPAGAAPAEPEQTTKTEAKTGLFSRIASFFR